MNSGLLTVRFDEQILLLQRRGGISRYVVELLCRFTADPELGVRPVLSMRRTRNEHALARSAELGLAPLPAAVPDRVARWWARRHRPAAADLVHHTYYDPAFLDRSAGTPRVVTVHDMIPELLGLDPNPHLAKREYVARADLILVNSAATRDDLIAVYGAPAAPVVVTPLGVDPGLAADPGPRPLAAPYLLHVGVRSGYKDFAAVVAAFRALAGRHPDLVLCTVGGGALTPAEVAMLDRAGLASRVRQVPVPDDALAGYYHHADAFVSASRLEGFGLPLLEAMACGAPAVVSRGPAQVEVGGEAPLYFRPGDADALAAALEDVLTDTGLAQRMRAAGRERAADFTWERTARETAAAYRMLA